MAKRTRLQKRRNYKQKSITRVKKTRMKRAGKKRASRKLYGGAGTGSAVETILPSDFKTIREKLQQAEINNIEELYKFFTEEIDFTEVKLLDSVEDTKTILDIINDLINEKEPNFKKESDEYEIKSSVFFNINKKYEEFKKNVLDKFDDTASKLQDVVNPKLYNEDPYNDYLKYWNRFFEDHHKYNFEELKKKEEERLLKRLNDYIKDKYYYIIFIIQYIVIYKKKIRNLVIEHLNKRISDASNGSVEYISILNKLSITTLLKIFKKINLDNFDLGYVSDTTYASEFSNYKKNPMNVENFIRGIHQKAVKLVKTFSVLNSNDINVIDEKISQIIEQLKQKIRDNNKFYETSYKYNPTYPSVSPFTERVTTYSRSMIPDVSSYKNTIKQIYFINDEKTEIKLLEQNMDHKYIQSRSPNHTSDTTPIRDRYSMEYNREFYDTIFNFIKNYIEKKIKKILNELVTEEAKDKYLQVLETNHENLTSFLTKELDFTLEEPDTKDNTKDNTEFIEMKFKIKYFLSPVKKEKVLKVYFKKPRNNAECTKGIWECLKDKINTTP